jgi:mannosyltransferase
VTSNAASGTLAAESRDRRQLPGYVSVVLLAALAVGVRFALIDHQSLWFDEIVSTTLAKQPFGAMLHDIAQTESTPPTYYILLWGWVRLFGKTAVALRSLSACFGVLTVLVIYATARLRFSRRAAFIAGALTATQPMLIWYSQETRSYSLVTLFVALSLYFFFRVRDDDSRRNLAGWAIASSLALSTHYFAAFVVFPEAALLLYVHRRSIRRSIIATAVPLATGGALLPLAIHQRNAGHTAFISTLSLGSRVHQTVNEFIFGNYEISALHLLAGCAVIAAAAAFSIRRWGSRVEQQDSLVLLTLALAAFALPLAFTPSAFFYRNLIVVLPSLMLLAGVTFAPRNGRTAAAVIGLLAAVALLAPTAVIVRRPALEREDWRDVAALVGRTDSSRAVFTYPRLEYVALSYYRPQVMAVETGVLHVREIVLVGRPKLDIHGLPAGFRRVEDKRVGTLRIVRLRSQVPRDLNVSALHLRPALRLLKPSGVTENRSGQDATLVVDRPRP